MISRSDHPKFLTSEGVVGINKGIEGFVFICHLYLKVKSKYFMLVRSGCQLRNECVYEEVLFVDFISENGKKLNSKMMLRLSSPLFDHLLKNSEFSTTETKVIRLQIMNKCG